MFTCVNAWRSKPLALLIYEWYRDQKVVQMFSRFPWQQELPLWYPPFPKYNRLLLQLRQVGLYRDEHLDFKENMDVQRRKRGKEPPKKGDYTTTVLQLANLSLATCHYNNIIIFNETITYLPSLFILQERAKDPSQRNDQLLSYCCMSVMSSHHSLKS